MKDRPFGGSHSSRPCVTTRLKQPTRVSRDETPLLSRETPIWPCSGWGLPCERCYQRPGALLPHPFTLACAPLRDTIGGLLSVALSLAPLAGRRRALPATLVSWSPDFPRQVSLTRLPGPPAVVAVASTARIAPGVRAPRSDKASSHEGNAPARRFYRNQGGVEDERRSEERGGMTISVLRCTWCD